MKKIYIGISLLLTLIGASCHNDAKECRIPCPLAAIDMRMKVKIVDKTTGADLLLSANSPYKPSDLKVTSSQTDVGFSFQVDTINHVIRLYDGQSVTYTVQLASLSADHIKIVTGLNSQKCCATTEVKSIMLNDSLICTQCNPQLELVIKK